MTELLGVNEIPYRVIIDLKATLSQLGHKPTQGEISIPATLQKPVAMVPR